MEVLIGSVEATDRPLLLEDGRHRIADRLVRERTQREEQVLPVGRQARGHVEVARSELGAKELAAENAKNEPEDEQHEDHVGDRRHRRKESLHDELHGRVARDESERPQRAECAERPQRAHAVDLSAAGREREVG